MSRINILRIAAVTLAIAAVLSFAVIGQSDDSEIQTSDTPVSQNAQDGHSAATQVNEFYAALQRTPIVANPGDYSDAESLQQLFADSEAESAVRGTIVGAETSEPGPFNLIGGEAGLDPAVAMSRGGIDLLVRIDEQAGADTTSFQRDNVIRLNIPLYTGTPENLRDFRESIDAITARAPIGAKIMVVINRLETLDGVSGPTTAGSIVPSLTFMSAGGDSRVVALDAMARKVAEGSTIEQLMAEASASLRG